MLSESKSSGDWWGRRPRRQLDPEVQRFYSRLWRESFSYNPLPTTYTRAGSPALARLLEIPLRQFRLLLQRLFPAIPRLILPALILQHMAQVQQRLRELRTLLQ